MSKPLVTFADPERLGITYLTAAFSGRGEIYKPATISTDFPTAALSGNTTHVQVELEVGDTRHYPVSEQANVRFTCYAAKDERTNVKALASLTEGLIYIHPGSTDVAGCSILVGRSDVVVDPVTKNLMVWFLARMNLKASAA